MRLIRPSLSLGGSIAEVDSLEALLVVGPTCGGELPVLAHRVRKAATVRRQRLVPESRRIRIAPFPVARQLVVAPAGQLAEINALLSAAGAGSPAVVPRRP